MDDKKRSFGVPNFAELEEPQCQFCGRCVLAGWCCKEAKEAAIRLQESKKREQHKPKSK